jgi:GTP cyclohydrolase I
MEAKPYPSTRDYLEQVSDIQLAQELLVRCAGLDPTHPQETRTAARFVQTLQELTTPDDYWEFTTFDNDGYDEMVTVGDIPFVSLCRHHILPFEGYAYLAYIPNKLQAGLSKLPRTVQYYAKSLQTQERLTSQIATYLEHKLDPLGVAVVLRAKHSCMSIRGVQSANALTTTADVRGVFADHSRTAKSEFLTWVRSTQA